MSTCQMLDCRTKELCPMGSFCQCPLELAQVSERRVDSKKTDILAYVEVLELSLRNEHGSKDLVNGTGSSWRKYSSGV